jgi:hypothetical protein
MHLKQSKNFCKELMYFSFESVLWNKLINNYTKVELVLLASYFTQNFLGNKNIINKMPFKIAWKYFLNGGITIFLFAVSDPRIVITILIYIWNVMHKSSTTAENVSILRIILLIYFQFIVRKTSCHPYLMLWCANLNWDVTNSEL